MKTLKKNYKGNWDKLHIINKKGSLLMNKTAYNH